MYQPLSLSQEQLDVIMQYAQSLPAQWRSRYLECVADQLFGNNVDDELLHTAAKVVFSQMIGGA